MRRRTPPESVPRPKDLGEKQKLTEKRIAKRDLVDASHVHVVEQVRVEVEEDGHVDRLAGVEPLLLEAEALDLAKVRGRLAGRDAVRGDADYVLVRLVGGRVERERRLPGQHADLALLRGELPGQRVGHGGVESDADARCRRHGPQALRGVVREVVRVDCAAVARRADGLAAPAGRLADLFAVKSVKAACRCRECGISKRETEGGWGLFSQMGNR